MCLLSLLVLAELIRMAVRCWPERSFVLQVWRRFRFGMFLQVGILILITLAAFVTLDWFVPVTRISLFNLMYIVQHGLPPSVSATDKEVTGYSGNVVTLP